ncbi:DUF4097 family beta strand repeat-containing protein [Lactobacillus acetotolerans]|uniref:DUF4097 family beta strand repeat-containing protein n=1 Tax=Lactobacillus acetotolerans TaxID=1600 RepID=UPI0019D2CF4C|nr:DUF4097 family beta strand repeat-containing protein [Lactobacillus acetotolerans]MBN7276814.1 DUF4097 family beta strand repeat protein [Lactobacillus acetotolerans]
MKKLTKKNLMIVLILIIGFVLTACSIVRHDSRDESKPKVVNQTLTSRKFKSLRVRTQSSTVFVKAGKKFAVTYHGEENLKPEVDWDKDSLSIEQKPKRFHKNNSEQAIAVTVPKKLTLVKIDAQDGAVLINDLSAKSLAVGSEDSKITVNNLTTTSGTKLRTEGGNIVVRNSHFTGYQINASDGRIEIAGKGISGDFYRKRILSKNVLNARSETGSIIVK